MTRWNPYDRGDARALELILRFLLNPNTASVQRAGSCLAIMRPARGADFVEVELEWERWSTGPLGRTVSVAYDRDTRTLYIARNDSRRRAPGDWYWTEREIDSEWVGAHARAIELSFEREAAR